MALARFLSGDAPDDVTSRDVGVKLTNFRLRLRSSISSYSAKQISFMLLSEYVEEILSKYSKFRKNYYY